ncbi:MAG: ribbon-helix-helix protein, CopG family [Bacillati bacterium ANGP1]|uniref:Ribbon-helix-helix protein, CopG family n=1 Tax=Candidatus Segetimicrobium genomatis TaxID=2569760 RepID=A0A537LI12_9BACT|nr:MAG: ribbon-helix-helix protein, CopG family [Terrabacteria group bacterium ANGP1]
MARKIQVMLDDETYRLLQELARRWARNKNFVVREALRRFADRKRVEGALTEILGKRHALKAMEVGIAALTAGRLVPHERVIKGIRRRASRSPRM